ncbi:MAG: HlyD family efflux transporter periplasmic adaptor subunit, partial [Verrucomicrobia bacterium]|nr:HlyD family efflux transporter periplasmic adaptor subunit [Verrucomicrobiota bacterium]
LLHIRRGDLTISLLQCLAQVIWWFHPAIWIVNRRINHLREACCDGEVLHHVKISSTSYAQALLNVVKQTPKISIPRYVSAVRSVEVTTQRIEKLMKTPQHLTHRTPIYGLLLTLGFAIFALPSAKIVSAEKKAKITDTVAESQVTESPIPTSPENPEKSSIVDIKQQFPQRFENQRTIPFPKNNRQVSIRRDGVLKVSRGKLYITGRSISGTVIPRNQLHIQSKVDGTVRRVNLTPGTKVKKGDLLLELTNDKLESALQEAELDLDTARTEIQQNQTLKEQEYLNAKSTLQEAELQLELRENEYSRKKSLFEKKLISKEDLSNAQNSLKQQKQILSFQLQSIEIMARKSEQSQKLKNLQLERFLLARESILRQLDDLRILAPMQGTIAPLKSSTDILIGTYVKAATPLAKLINVDQLTVRASYPADDISEIEEGMACQVRVNGNEHGGKIGTIYPTADMNRKVTFLVELTSPSSNSTRIIPGSIARVYVVRGEKADVLSVAQRSSNMIEGTHMMVYKISPFGNTATETEVTFGEQGMGRIEITGPLEEGDQISQTNHGFTRKLSDHRNITVLQNKEIAR